MPEFKGFDELSEQLELLNKDERTFLDLRQQGGPLKLAVFSVAVGGSVNGTLIGVCKIPKGADIIETHFSHGAMGTSRTADIGFYTADGVEIDDDILAEDSDLAAAGDKTIRIKGTDGPYLRTDQEVVVTFTTAGGTYTADRMIRGHVAYIER
jgi:hypothetical protein